jgi:hypothetical protein
MGIRVPKNKIKTGLYTSGGEFLIAKTQQRYQGYYYELNERFYAGKEFKDDSPELIKSTSDKVNKLLSNPFTNLYGIISGMIIGNTKPKSIYFNPETAEINPNDNTIMRYFTKKVNENIIKEIDENNFNQIKDNPIYISVFLHFRSNGFDQNELNEAEKKIPGITDYVNTIYVPGVTD